MSTPKFQLLSNLNLESSSLLKQD